MIVHDDRGLLALQGPAAVETLGPLVNIDLSKMYFSNFAKLDIAGISCYLTRTGYALLSTPEVTAGITEVVTSLNQAVEMPHGWWT